jgi:hypothetical protein
LIYNLKIKILKRKENKKRSERLIKLRKSKKKKGMNCIRIKKRGYQILRFFVLITFYLDILTDVLSLKEYY